MQPALPGVENKGIAKADFGRLLRLSGQLVLAQGRLDAEDIHGSEHGDVVAHGSGMVYPEIAGQGVVGGLSAGAADNEGGMDELEAAFLVEEAGMVFVRRRSSTKLGSIRLVVCTCFRWRQGTRRWLSRASRSSLSVQHLAVIGQRQEEISISTYLSQGFAGA